MTNNKKVVLIRNANSFDFGGAERFPVFLAKVLEKNGSKPILVSRHTRLLDFAGDNSVKTVRGWWWSRQNWSGSKAVLFPIYFIWQIVLFFWYLQLFVRTRPDVIHIQSKDDFIAATWAGKILGKKIIWTDHADLKHIWQNISVWYKNPVGKLVHWSARFADTIMVISKSELSLVGTNLRKDDPTRDRMKIVYNGVADVAKQYQKTTGRNFTYSVVSRMVSDKGIGEIIEAFNNLSHDYPNDQLLLIGDGPESDKFTRLAKDNPQIKVLGYQKDPLKYIAKCDVFVHPAYHEGLGISLLEASMLSKPIIATGVGGIVEIIKNGRTGLLVKEKDVNSLQNAMKLARNDEKLLHKLGKAARDQYEARYNFDDIVKNEIIPLYNEVRL